MNGQNDNESPSIEVLLGHITALQLMVADLVVLLKRKETLTEQDVRDIFAQSGLRDGKTYALDAGAQIRRADSHNVLRDSIRQVRDLLHPGV